ncbi:aminopeptidase N [Aquella oligotrophica]|uniref:Aminopeptidase N n=1 Tax=Aquella oligotrophica TaxID=2067065 RepID=A0A2I7N2V4_9NEIS|nr:aminopeptidase N [Aquella oligotrophica]AUR50772.1 aminopeptidase N [Aquella oligotrophica]
MTNIATKYLKDYQATSYLVDTIDLKFEIKDTFVIVTSKTKYQQNGASNSLELAGSAELKSVIIDGNELTDYKLADDKLSLNNLSANFTLEIVTHVDAFNNKSCMGLYASNGNLFTQCEPEGFRKITYYLDRPDVMAKFTTTIIGDKDLYPVLLSNGNKISEKTLANNQIEVIWEDPYKKPSYLFALVAGKFAFIDDTFTTKSGRKVKLEVYSEAESINQCQHCLESLKRAMEWDEKRFNLEYDLDVYMIVASGDFNMGAMENKGLNIFNTKYVLAETKTATDTDFINVEAVVGHEYFHNWTGNRVTCRDWFQLSLKEGLTVFRDQEFTADLHSRTVKRIQDVKNLRQMQFTEDASPLSHPVRPESYMEINNFYTMTVYEKGAEVVRMYQTILDKEGFNRGLALYFERHDGYAVTCEDFCKAMADANKIDLSQFMLWYSQSGTPHLAISDHYNEATKEYSITFKQSIPNNPTAKAMLIPVSIGLILDNGKNIIPDIKNHNTIVRDNEVILLLNEAENTFIFGGISEKPTPSILRGFSAPVIINYAYDEKQLYTLARHDNDSFNRWEALQSIYKTEINRIYHSESPDKFEINQNITKIISELLNDATIDPALKALSINLPAFAELSISYPNTDVKKLVGSIKRLKSAIANGLETQLLAVYKDNQTVSYDFNDAGKRALKNTLLGYLMQGNNTGKSIELVAAQYKNADNMTDKIGALSAINDIDSPVRHQLLDNFAQEYANYPLVMDKWFSLQSQSQLPDTIDNVANLLNHPSFDKENPNKLYSLVRAFTANPIYFNTDAGYNFIAEEIIRIDSFNPGVAGRIANGFSSIANYESKYQTLVKPQLQKIMAKENLSRDVYEIISKTLQQIQ